MTPPSEKTTDACPLDEGQQRRILDAVFTGPIVDLLGEVARRLPNRPKKSADEADYALTTQRRLNPMQLDIPLTDDNGRAGLPWPGSGLTRNDQRRLATMGNTTKLSSNRLIHHSVRVAHHIFQSILLEIMATSERTGVAVRDLLTTTIGDNGHSARDGTLLPQADSTSQLDADHPGVELPDVHKPGTIGDAVETQAIDRNSVAAEEADEACIALSIPPNSMTKRTATAAPREGVTDERIEELEAQMQRLQETMDTLIGSIDEFRDDLIHTLRNLPDRLPPPLHIHSLPLDPTDSDFAERVNAIPQEVMARLREEAGRARRGESAGTTAAEGNPSPAPVVNETTGGTEPRRQSRQGKLFA